MQQWPEHSLYGYFKRLTTYKLELILDSQNTPTTGNVLQLEDYEFIRQILWTRPDSKLFQQKQLWEEYKPK